MTPLKQSIQFINAVIIVLVSLHTWAVYVCVGYVMGVFVC